MPVETITLRKTVAGTELYAKAAEYDSEGHKISEKFRGALDITEGDGIHVSKVGDALNISHRVSVVSPVSTETVENESNETEYRVTVSLNKYTMISDIPADIDRLVVIVPPAEEGVLQEAAFQFDVGETDDFVFDIVTGGVQLKRIAPLALTPENSYQGTVVGGLCTLGEYEPVEA